MSTLVRDVNSNVTQIKAGLGDGGFFELDDGNWRRLMPDGNDGSLHATDRNKLNIGSLPDNIVDVVGWKLYILNTGYFQQFTVREYEDSYVVFSKNINYYAALPNTAVEYVLLPQIIVPISITNLGDSSRKVDIGIMPEDKYIAPAASSSDIRKRATLSGGKGMKIYFSDVDKIFVKNMSSNPGTNTVEVSWGEHCISD